MNYMVSNKQLGWSCNLKLLELIRMLLLDFLTRSFIYV